MSVWQKSSSIALGLPALRLAAILVGMIPSRATGAAQDSQGSEAGQAPVLPRRFRVRSPETAPARREPQEMFIENRPARRESAGGAYPGDGR